MARTTGAAVVLALASAAAAMAAACADPAVRWSHSQCLKYNPKDLEAKQRLLKKLELAPVGEGNVSCSKDERRCLQRYRLWMVPDGPCKLLGSPCNQDQQGPKEECKVRANWAIWRSSRHLVGECACAPRCSEDHLPVRRSGEVRWKCGKDCGRCVHAGHLLCACAPPAVLQPATFGGYACVTRCTGTCSSQRGPLCVFPPLGVEDRSVLQVSDIFKQREKYPVYNNANRILGSDQGQSKIDGAELEMDSRNFHQYLPRSFRAMP